MLVWWLDIMNNIILVVSNKKVSGIKNDDYKGIGVANNRDNIFSDATGDNITEKNPYYCELTAMYWAWKNLYDYKYIGLCHYRRFFWLNNYENEFIVKNIELMTELEKYICTNKLSEYFSDCDIILPAHEDFGVSIEQQYIATHSRDEWNVLKRVVAELYPEYKDDMEYVFKQDKCSCYNMFITRKDVFDNYSEWLFSILFCVEKQIIIPNNAYDRRVFGFMAERLLNLYVYHNNLKKLEVPIIFIGEGKEKKRNFKYKLKGVLVKKLFFIYRHKRRLPKVLKRLYGQW